MAYGRFFKNCKTIEDLKKTYKKLAKENHPDFGGDTRTMQEINAEYDRMFNALKDKYNAEAADGKSKPVTETPETFRAIVEVLLSLDGVELEICGTWLWISGNTYPNKDVIKAAGCKWSRGKKKWYWTSDKLDGYKRGTYSMNKIREIYGSEKIGTGSSANGKKQLTA